MSSQQGAQDKSNGGSGGGKAASIPMQDCSNDESGLPLPSLKVSGARCCMMHPLRAACGTQSQLCMPRRLHTPTCF